MSSIAATQADGFYHPPEWDPQKHGRRDKFQGSRGSNQWEKYGVIRFELPFDGWCLGCGRPVGLGTRFNAKKTTVGKYHSSKIYEFAMKCASCPEQFVIRTNPKDTDYDYVSGIRKKDTIQSATDLGTIALDTDEQRIKRAADPIAALEHAVVDERKGKQQKRRIEAMIDRNVPEHYRMNRVLRDKARVLRKEEAQRKLDGVKFGLPVPLCKETDSDVHLARRVMSSSREANTQSVVSSAEDVEKRARFRIANQSIFASSETRRSTERLIRADRTRAKLGVGPVKVVRSQPSSKQATVVVVKRRRLKKRKSL